MMRRVAVVAVAMMIAASRLHAQSAAITDDSVTSDADDFQSFRIRAGALAHYASPFEYWGATVQQTHYAHDDASRNAPAVSFLWRKQKRETLEGTIAEAGITRVSGRIRPIVDATWSIRPRPRTGIEVIGAADLVETVGAIDRGVAYTFGGASVEHQFADRFTAIGLAGFQRFTDDNDRIHLRGRLIASLVPSYGISAQLRYRQYNSDTSDVGGLYFNPQRYRQWDGALSMRRRHAGWNWYGVIAAGQEFVEGDARGTGNLELRTEGPLPHDMRIVIRAAYNRSAGYAIADRYWYGVAGVTLIIPIH
jgi:hypothetical protein